MISSSSMMIYNCYNCSLNAILPRKRLLLAFSMARYGQIWPDIARVADVLRFILIYDTKTWKLLHRIDCKAGKLLGEGDVHKLSAPKI